VFNVFRNLALLRSCAIKATKRGIPSPDLYVFNVFRNLALCALALLMAQSAKRRVFQHVKHVQVWTGIPCHPRERAQSAKRRVFQHVKHVQVWTGIPEVPLSKYAISLEVPLPRSAFRRSGERDQRRNCITCHPCHGQICLWESGQRGSLSYLDKVQRWHYS
jgi:hypothetical protein